MFHVKHAPGYSAFRKRWLSRFGELCRSGATTPHRDDDGTFELTWTLAVLLNPLVEAELVRRRVVESPAKDSRFW